MFKAICIDAIGGVEQFKYREEPLPTLQPNQVLIKHTAIGVNYIDIYFRSGVYSVPKFPHIIGAEAVGIVVGLGEDVEHIKLNDRVGYVGKSGAYSTHAVVSSNEVISIPSYISDQVAAASLLKGMTAYYLLHRTFKVQSNHTVLYHAAAGGVGLLIGQWGKHIGATMIGTVGDDSKIDIAKAHGYAHVINYKKEDFVQSVKSITLSQGVEVVYDSIGKDTYPQSLHCLKRLGMWVSFGQSSGVIKNFDFSLLSSLGSLFTTRPTLFAYIATPQELKEASTALFHAIHQKILDIHIHSTFPLTEAGKAHQLLESRTTQGSIVLIP